MPDDFFGPLGLGDLETPEKRGRFINIEAIDAYIEKATMEDITVSGSSTLNDVTINDATIDNATITNADIDSLSYDKIVSGTNPNTLTHSGTFNVTGDLNVTGSLDLGGDLTMGTGGVIAFASAAPRLIVDYDQYGSQDIVFESGHQYEYSEGKWNFTSADSTPFIYAQLALTGTYLGDATNRGSGNINITSDYYNSKGEAEINAIAYGNWDSLVDIAALALNTGDADVQITASSTSGASTITFSADDYVFGGTSQISIPDGTAAAPALTNTGNTNTGLFFSDTNEIAFSSGGTRAWMMKKVSNDSRLYTTELNDYMEYDNNTEEWAWYIDGTARLNVTAGVTYVGSTLFRIPKKTSTGDPTATDEGDMYVNTVDNVLKVYEGGSWRTVASW